MYFHTRRPLSPTPEEDFQTLDHINLDDSPRPISPAKSFTPTNPAQINPNDHHEFSNLAAPPPYPFGIRPDLVQSDPSGINLPPVSHVIVLPCQCGGPLENGLYQVISPAEYKHRRLMAYMTVFIFIFVAISCIIFFVKVHSTIEQSYEEAVRSLGKTWTS